MSKTLEEWQTKVYYIAQIKGYYTDESVFELLGNIMAETAETWEEARQRDFEPMRVYHDENGAPHGLPIELADIIIRVLGTARKLGIDLEKAMEDKCKFNQTRPPRDVGKKI